MKNIYLDIMEKALSAYNDDRIREYVDDVKQNGLTEHGFPRLCANIGILIAYGRRRELLPVFIEIMDICCSEMPRKKAANDFSVREVCCCLMLLEEKNTVDTELIKKWKESMAGFEPWTMYTRIAGAPNAPVDNWSTFAGVSDFIRGKCSGVDTSEFVEHQISAQLLLFDTYGMFQDPNNPMVYDVVPRVLMGFLLNEGYSGKLKDRIEDCLNKSAEITSKMQSVTGEIPFGGRSNQFLNNEAMLVGIYEFYASKFAREGDMKKAGEFKAAALLSQKCLLEWLDMKPVSHIKNRYDVSTMMGCESYGYFNKYMITVASFAYLAFLMADDSIEPTVSVTEKGGYVIQTGENFHKCFINCGGYFLELDTNADFHYDANGLGRVHKKGCASTVCLSVPFAHNPNYAIEGENSSAMSLCCFADVGDKCLTGAEEYAKYRLIEYNCDENCVKAVFECGLSGNTIITENYTVTRDGVDIKLSGAENIGFMIPAFDFDGVDNAKISLSEKTLSVGYNGSKCTYSFDGEIFDDYEYFYNRNGRYRVYKMNGKHLHIVLN